MIRVNLRQRIVMVIGLGTGLVFFGEWATSRGSAFGWVGYAPFSNTTFAPAGGLQPWARLLVWLGLTILWTGTSLFLLRSSGKDVNVLHDIESCHSGRSH